MNRQNFAERGWTNIEKIIGACAGRANQGSNQLLSRLVILILLVYAPTGIDGHADFHRQPGNHRGVEPGSVLSRQVLFESLHILTRKWFDVAIVMDDSI